MNMEKYKGFIIIGLNIWFDYPDYKECNSFMEFSNKDQIKPWINKYTGEN